MQFNEKVLRITHYSDSMFSFRTTRDRSFRFKNGEFCMIGLNGIFRAYSIVSTNYDDYIEFLSIKVPDGPLTSKLQQIRAGDIIDIKPKTTGSLCVDYLQPKENLILLCTGTGVAPFMSVVRDFETYDRFEKVHIYHTTRLVSEQVYRDEMKEAAEHFPLSYTGTVTQEPHDNAGRFWSYLEADFTAELDKKDNAIMVCGSPSLNKQCRTKFSEMGWQEGNHGEMGDFLLERAFAG